jgi:hypothetical protein
MLRIALVPLAEERADLSMDEDSVEDRQEV